MMRSTKTVLLVFLFLKGLSSCGANTVDDRPGSDAGTDDGGASDLTSDFVVEPTEDDLDGDGIPNDIEDLNQNGRYDPGGRETDANNPDTDGDGLIDGAEDGNANGSVESDETDPRLADTDGDGLGDGVERTDHGTDPTKPDSDGDGLTDGAEVDSAGTDPLNPDSDSDGLTDGEEDRNGDGTVDGTETDPLVQDTDGDGTLDASEPVQVACALSRQPAFTTLGDELGDYSLVLANNIDQSGLFSLGGASGALPRGGFFQEGEGDVFGFVIIKSRQSTILTGVDQAEEESIYLSSVADVSNRQVIAVERPGGPSAAMVALSLGYDSEVGARNVRDGVAAAVARRSVSDLGGAASPPGPSATDWVVRLSTALHGDNEVAIVGAVSPAARLSDDPTLEQRLLDLTDTTALGAYEESPNLQCAQQPIDTTALPVDILWLVDRALSLQQERNRLVALSETFFDTLASTLLDFRLAVSSTGMHNDDSWVLVSPGFSSSRDDFVSQMNDPPGGSLEYGLATGIKILTLARSASTSGGTHVRSDAKLIVVFMSDNQDQGIELQIQQGVPGCDPGSDPSLSGCPLLQQQIGEYVDMDVTAFAIVGDNPGGCGTSAVPLGYAEEAGRGYIQTAYGTGGGFGSICSADLTEPIDQMIRSSYGAASETLLSPPPVSSTLRVVVNGTLVPRRRDDGFDYDPASGTLLFYGDHRPAIGAEVFVSYRKFL